jgi:hypothetical protein
MALCIYTWYADLSPRSEMDSLRRKILGRSLPKRGKDRRELRSDALARRQSECYVLEAMCSVPSVYMIPGDKNWLETHLWHAKRMHMENMWGYRLVGTLFLRRFPLIETRSRQFNPPKNLSDRPIALLFMVPYSTMHHISVSLN